MGQCSGRGVPKSCRFGAKGRTFGSALLEENHKDTKAQRKDGILRHLSPFVAWCLGGSVFGGLLVFVFRGSTAELLLEGTGEIGLVGEAELVGYLGYCSGILFQ